MLYRLLAALATAALVMLGFFFLTIALAIGAAVALVIGVRLWWTLRKLKKMQAEAGPISATRDSGNPVIDGDFQVVERENNNPRLPQEPRQ
jgi:predicted lipid-binding transport protein (Tim44 family)